MRTLIEFDGSPEDNEDYRIYAQSFRMACVIKRMEEEFRKVTKYGKTNKTDLKWQKKFWDIIKEYELDI